MMEQLIFYDDELEPRYDNPELELNFGRHLFSGKLLEVLLGRFPEGDPIDSKHFYYAATALENNRMDEFAARLAYVAREYADIEDVPEEFYWCFRELATLGGLDFDLIETVACRPMSKEELLTALADLVESLPDDSSIKEWVEEIQIKAFFNPEGS